MVGPFLFASPHVQVLKMGWPQIDANWDKRQPSQAWQCTESTLRVVRKMLQWCTNEIWKAGVDKSRARVHAIGLKSHVSSLATLGRIFWRNADLGTFAKFSRGNSRTFNQVPKICRAKCTHRHPQSLAAFDRIHCLHLLRPGGLAFYRWIQMDKSKFSAKLGWDNSRIQGNSEVKSQKWWQW